MADLATSKIYDNGASLVANLTSVSDGTGEAAAPKIDASDYSAAALAIRRITGSTSGMSVRLLFDATTDSFAFQIPADQWIDITFDPPLRNPCAAGFTGDIVLTTTGHTLGDAYALQIECIKTAGVA